MTTPDPMVTVVVVTFNSAHLVPDLLTSLEDGLKDCDWRLAVADNDSRDGTVDLLRDLAPDATIVEMGRNAGYAAGINAAAAAVGPEGPVLVLNPDVRLSPGCVSALLGALDEDGIGIAVPRLVDGYDELIASMRREPTVLRAAAEAVIGARRAGRFPLLGETVTDPALYDRTATTDWAEGSTQLLSTACVAACWPWDETFFLYSEETDFHLRARDAGFAIRYVPDARAVHLGGESTTSSSLWALLVANQVKLFVKRHGVLRAAPYWFVLLTRELSRALLGRRRSQRAVSTLLNPGRLLARRGPEWVA